MAEKKIEIKIAATGGDQAAAEVKKVSDAEADYQQRKEAFEARRASGAFDRQSAGGDGGGGFGGMLDASPERVDEAVEAADKIIAKTEEATEAIEEQAEAVEGLGAASEEAADQASDLEENVDKIARAQKAQVIAQLAGEVGKIGQKFLDVADDVESFDADLADTLRNSGENIQKVSGAVTALALGFAAGGPLGAAAAGVAVVLGEVINQYVEAGNAAVEMEAKSASAFESLTDKLGGVAAAKSSLEFKTWLATLTEEEAAISLQNDALGRNRELLEAKLAAQARLDAAQTKNRITEIESDPNLTDAEKIRRKAAESEGLARRQVEGGINAQGRGVRAAEQDAAAKDAAAKRLADDARQVAELKAADDAEREALEQREKQRLQAQEALPGAAAAQALLNKSTSLISYNPFRDSNSKRRIQDETAAKQEELEQLRNQATPNPREAARLEELRKNQAETDAAAKKTADDAERAREEAERAKLDAANKRRILEETAPLAAQTYQEEARGRGTQTAAAAAAAEKRDADRKAAEEKRRESEIARQQREAGGLGRAAEGLVPKEATEQLRQAVSRVANGLQDGDQGGELKKLLDLMDKIADVVGVKGTKTDTAITALEAKISVLQSQMKNKGGGSGTGR